MCTETASTCSAVIKLSEFKARYYWTTGSKQTVHSDLRHIEFKISEA